MNLATTHLVRRAVFSLHRLGVAGAGRRGGLRAAATAAASFTVLQTVGGIEFIADSSLTGRHWWAARRATRCARRGARGLRALPKLRERLGSWEG
jgi:hypothetical protein